MPKKISNVSSGTTRATLASAIRSAIAASLGVTVTDNKVALDAVGFPEWYISVSVDQKSSGGNDTETIFELNNGSAGISRDIQHTLSSALSSGHITSVCYFSKDSKSMIISVANSSTAYLVENGYSFMAFVTFDSEGVSFGGAGVAHIGSIMCGRKAVYSSAFPDAMTNISGKHVLCPMPNYVTYTLPRSVSTYMPVTVPSFEDSDSRLFEFSVDGRRFAMCDSHINEGFKTYFCPVVEW